MRETIKPNVLEKWKGVNQRLQPTLVPDDFFYWSSGLYFGLGSNAERLTGKVPVNKFNKALFGLFPWGNKMIIQRQDDLLIADLDNLGARASKTYTYISNGDANGICYARGVVAGGGTWANPSGVTVTMSSSGLANGVIAELTNRAVSDVYTTNNAGSYYSIDWGLNHEVQVLTFSYRARNSAGSFPTAFKLQGSTNGSSWVDLQAWTGLSLTSDQWYTQSVAAGAFYRYHRLLWTAVDSSGFNFATIGEWEFYGNQYQ